MKYYLTYSKSLYHAEQLYQCGINFQVEPCLRFHQWGLLRSCEDLINLEAENLQSDKINFKFTLLAA